MSPREGEGGGSQAEIPTHPSVSRRVASVPEERVPILTSRSTIFGTASSCGSGHGFTWVTRRGLSVHARTLCRAVLSREKKSPSRVNTWEAQPA
ncbi:unnamed protein product [Lampetra fluviatilis]